MIKKINDITIQKYSNGSYSYWDEGKKAWYNIPKELAKKIIAINRVEDKLSSFENFVAWNLSVPQGKITILESIKLYRSILSGGYIDDAIKPCKHIRREGESCMLNDNCKYPNCE
jgi:hypothetical protein